jgi:glucosamine 6-phosphate synthetase-like amidotransferase/phosphosugar isomerase protein
MLAVYLLTCAESSPQKAQRTYSGFAKGADSGGKTLEHEVEVEKVAAHYKDTRSILYLGRGINMPIAYKAL